MRSSKHNPFRQPAAAPIEPRPRSQALIGAVEWFRPGNKDHVEEVLADLQQFEITELRTGVSWTDYSTPGGPEWYAWLLPRLAQQVNVLPCLADSSGLTNANGVSPNTNGDAQSRLAFVDTVLDRFGKYYDCVELCAPVPSANSEWMDDSDWKCFSNNARHIAGQVHKAGKRIALTISCNPKWLDFLGRLEVLQAIDILGVRTFPSQQLNWQGWRTSIEQLRAVLDEYKCRAPVWITETGYSTIQHDYFQQAQSFLAAIEAPVDRVYWYTLRDIDRTYCNGSCTDEHTFYYGLKTAAGGHKLLSRIWADHGIEGLYQLQRTARRLPQPSSRKYTLITGGAGFIGSNLANRLMGAGRHVMIFDTLARPGVERNLEWLHERHGDRLLVEIADIRNAPAIRRAVQNAEQAFDFSAQVAVTTSLIDPIHDFEVNARGTINLLEAIRSTGRPIPVVFTSTNKVYGSLDDVRLRAFGDRYEPISRTLRMQGVDEQRPLDFHSPYGCSKGAADQYVLDYARTMGVPAVVFRMSCIYGPRQFGTEDQGWVAHFLIRAMQGMPITLYGDGRQVRDILFIEDLLDAFELAQAHMSRLTGHAFNIGGGPPRTISLLELIRLIEEVVGDVPLVRYEDWRPADQKYYVSNTLRFQRATGWGPRVGVQEGVRRLYEWLREFHAPVETTKSEHAVAH